MNRRDLLGSAVAAAALVPFGTAAQQKPMPRIGLLYPNSLEQWGARAREGFQEGLRSLGWIEGKTVSIDYRFANGDPALLSANAADLAAEKVDLIVAFSGFAAQAAREATSTIPIVMDAGDPVGMGLVAKLVAKQLEVFKEAVPSINKIVVLLQFDYSGHAQQMIALERAATTLGVSVLPVDVTPQDLQHRFSDMTTTQDVNGYFLLAAPQSQAMRDDIAKLALHHRLPGAAQLRTYVEAGVLLSYGMNIASISRHLTIFLDKILKGAKPADLPVEQPTKFELLINLKTAKALGINVPQSLLQRADEVIE